MKERNIIFIFSLPRSGSTLLQRMLSAHSEICTAGEPWFLLHFLYITKTYGIFSEYNQSHCHNAFNNFLTHLPDGIDDFRKDLKTFAVSQYSRAKGTDAVFFLDKTPRYYLIIPEIVSLFPEAKFIFLFRNPIQIFSSFIETWYKGFLLLHGTHIDLFRGPRLLASGRRLISEKSIAINYEDLIANPQKTLTRIFDYLGLNYEDQCLEHFQKVDLRGRLGDKTGYETYDTVNCDPLIKWQSGIDTMVKKKYANYFLSSIGHIDLTTLGYQLEELRNQLNGHSVSKLGLMDLLGLMTGQMIRLLEPFIFLRKIKQKKQFGDHFAVHR